MLCRTGVGGALHYCHGAQAPGVIKNKMRGLAVKLNGEKAAFVKQKEKLNKMICPKSIPKVGLEAGPLQCLSPCSNLNRKQTKV